MRASQIYHHFDEWQQVFLSTMKEPVSRKSWWDPQSEYGGAEGSSLHTVGLQPCIKIRTCYEWQHDSQSVYIPWKDSSIS